MAAVVFSYISAAANAITKAQSLQQGSSEPQSDAFYPLHPRPRVLISKARGVVLQRRPPPYRQETMADGRIYG